MKLGKIIEFLDGKIPESLALDSDEVGFKGDYDLERDITSIRILMDLVPEDDIDFDGTLTVTHHPPLFIPKAPTYTIHSNWDIIDGGANDALAAKLNLEVVDCLDPNTGIGRVCKSDVNFGQLKGDILKNFNNVTIVNDLDNEKTIKKVGVISGFGLKNPSYIELAKTRDLDVLISGDLTHQCAILAKNLEVTLIDLTHHDSEVPGLYALGEALNELDVDVEVIDKRPMDVIK